MTFEEWLKHVDRELIAIVGMTQADLGDWPSRDTYDAGFSPTDGAIECLEWNDFPEDLL